MTPDMMPSNMLTPDNEVVSDYVRLRDDHDLSAKAGEAKARLQQSENARADSNHDPDTVDPFAPPETPEPEVSKGQVSKGQMSKGQMSKGQLSNATPAPLWWYTPPPRPQGRHPSHRQILL